MSIIYHHEKEHSLLYVAGDIGVVTGTPTGFSLIPDSGGTFSRSLQVTGKVFAGSYVAPTPAQLTAASLDLQVAYIDANGRTSPGRLNLDGGTLIQATKYIYAD